MDRNEYIDRSIKHLRLHNKELSSRISKLSKIATRADRATVDIDGQVEELYEHMQILTENETELLGQVNAIRSVLEMAAFSLKQPENLNEYDIIVDVLSMDRWVDQQVVEDDPELTEVLRHNYKSVLQQIKLYIQTARRHA